MTLVTAHFQSTDILTYCYSVCVECNTNVKVYLYFYTFIPSLGKVRSSLSVCAACVFVFSFYVSLSLFVVYISLYTFEHSSCWCGRAHLSVQRVQPLQPPSSPRAGEGWGEAGRREAGLRGNRDNSRTGHPAPPTASRLLREQPCDHLLLQSRFLPPKQPYSQLGSILVDSVTD